MEGFPPDTWTESGQTQALPAIVQSRVMLTFHGVVARGVPVGGLAVILTGWTCSVRVTR